MITNTRSIRIKILSSTLVVLLILALTMGITSVLVVNRLAKTDSEQLMVQRCEEEALRFDNKLNLVRHSVNMIYAYARELQAMGQFDILSREYEETVRDLSVTIANDTDGAMAVYFRYDPQLVGNGTSGFFWSRKAEGAKFTEEPPTDIMAYSFRDVERVGWFYVPKETGEPIWMTPYYNKNIGVLMISYIIPMYLDNGVFVGVIGMDIDFSSIMNTAGNVTLYESGRLSLIDLTERIIYSCDKNGNAVDEPLSQKFYNHVTTINKASELLKMTDADGTAYVSCCKRLSNGMLLYLNVPTKEINANRDHLICILAAVTFFICLIAALLIWHSTNHLIQPIKSLVEVANNYAHGDWDEKYVCDSGDELQELSESISSMADQTREYIRCLDHLARIDAMTGIRNKMSYMEMTQEIAENKDGRYDRYAVVVMDLNNLKKTNDTFGHEAGDAMIKEASRYICSTFQHSPVFRIGGDEFVALLLGKDYASRELLLTQFEGGMGYEVLFEIPLYISFGMALPKEAGNDYSSTFHLADERMYQKKAEMRQRK